MSTPTAIFLEQEIKFLEWRGHREFVGRHGQAGYTLGGRLARSGAKDMQRRHYEPKIVHSATLTLLQSATLQFSGAQSLDILDEYK